MRFRHVMAALLPAGTASALAILPAAGITAIVPHALVHKVTPAVQNPLAYKYAGKVTGNSAPVFSCQLPGSAINCYGPQELAKAYDIPASLTGACDHRHHRRLRQSDDRPGPQRRGHHVRASRGETQHHLPGRPARLRPEQRRRGRLVRRDRARRGVGARRRARRHHRPGGLQERPGRGHTQRAEVRGGSPPRLGAFAELRRGRGLPGPVDHQGG